MDSKFTVFFHIYCPIIVRYNYVNLFHNNIGGGESNE